MFVENNELNTEHSAYFKSTNMLFVFNSLC